MTAQQLHAQLEQKRGELAELFAKHKTDTGYDMDEATRQEIRNRNDELTELGKEHAAAYADEELAGENQRELERMGQPVNRLPFPGGREDRAPARKSIGELFTASTEYKGRTPSGLFSVDMPDAEVKATMTRSAGFEPESTRTGDVVPFASRTPMVQDLLPITTTTQAQIVWMEQTTRDASAVVPKAEAAAAGEVEIVYTQRTQPVERIPATLPVTMEQLEDEPQIRDLLDQDLMLMLMQAEESQIMAGDGNTPNLMGFLTKVTQSQAKGTDSVPDAIRRAMTKVRVTGRARPTGVIIHPNDWQDIRLLQTDDKNYLWGPPSVAGPESIWGLPIVETDVITENTALLGDFVLHSRLYRRMGIAIEITNSHSTNFTKGIRDILATMRSALVIRRIAAFCKVTGV